MLTLVPSLVEVFVENVPTIGSDGRLALLALDRFSAQRAIRYVFRELFQISLLVVMISAMVCYQELVVLKFMGTRHTVFFHERAINLCRAMRRSTRVVSARR